MDWPRTPIESQDDFEPPFCPRRTCPEHLRTTPGFRFVRWGTYSTLQQKDIPRFLCSTCEKTFSRQTFAATYYLKRRPFLPAVAAGIVAGSAHRQIARTLRCAPTSVSRLAARLGRHAMLLQARALDRLRGKVDEPFVLDHFETFEFTQDYPFGVATPVGAESWFVYGLDPAPHVRTGKRTPAQRERLARRPPRERRGCYLGSTRRTLDLLENLVEGNRAIVLRGDAHPAYDRAVKRHPRRARFETAWFANPKRGPRGSARSPEAVARDEAMFPVDLLHKILRHTGAHYRRETIAFARRLNAAMERLFLTAAWRNFVKRRSERRPLPETPASRLGLTGGPWSWTELLHRRLFFRRQPMPELWQTLYRRMWETPVLGSNSIHDAKYAF
jgi:transposase-like protein